MTKHQYITTYEALLVARYPWARDAKKLERYMNEARGFILGTGGRWTPAGQDVAQEAWRQLGCTGHITNKALLALPEGGAA